MDFTGLRASMVQKQIASRGIIDEDVLDAMGRVPRHEFVPESAQELAYNDCPLPIGEGQTISQPYMVALMTQCLALDHDDLVLEVGTGSGYQTAVLAELCREVVSVERVEALAERARKKLAGLGYANVTVIHGDGSIGAKCGPSMFDAIIVTAGAPSRPDRLLAQLTDGGRLVVPEGARLGQTLKLYMRSRGKILEQAVCNCVFVPLIGEDGWPED